MAIHEGIVATRGRKVAERHRRDSAAAETLAARRRHREGRNDGHDARLGLLVLLLVAVLAALVVLIVRSGRTRT